MGTHPIFESDFDCLTDMNDVEREIGEVSYGCFLAIVGAVACGASMPLQKIGVIRKRKAAWLLGLVCLIIGEIFTVLAYTYAPAVLVSPLGAVRVVTTTLVSVKFLNENLTRAGKIGIGLSILGAILIVYNAPKHNSISSFDDLSLSLQNPTFVFFFLMCAGLCFWLSWFVAPSSGAKNLFVYISITNIIGAHGVLLSKGIGIVIGAILNDSFDYLFRATTWFVLSGVIFGAVAQLYYLNLALKFFDAALIAPLKYVGTNVLVVIGSCILYQEFELLTANEATGLLGGFGIVTLGTFYIHGTEFYSCQAKIKSDK